MLGCGLLLGLLALQATPAAGSSFNIYVVNAFDNNVVVFNSDTQEVVTTFPVGRVPRP
jgi:YVTN family beta-propeller protein